MSTVGAPAWWRSIEGGMHPSRTVSQSTLGASESVSRTPRSLPEDGERKKLRSSVFGEFCVLFGTSPAASLTHIRRRPCDCNTHESPQRRVARDALLRLDVAIHEPNLVPNERAPAVARVRAEAGAKGVCARGAPAATYAAHTRVDSLAHRADRHVPRCPISCRTSPLLSPLAVPAH